MTENEIIQLVAAGAIAQALQDIFLVRDSFRFLNITGGRLATQGSGSEAVRQTNTPRATVLTDSKKERR